MTLNASKQGKFGSLGATFLLICLPCMWGVGVSKRIPNKIILKKSMSWKSTPVVSDIMDTERSVSLSFGDRSRMTCDGACRSGIEVPPANFDAATSSAVSRLPCPDAYHRGQDYHLAARIITKILFIRGRHGGWKKEGGGKPHEWHPSQRGVGPPSYGTFSTPLTCQCSVFPVQKSTTEQTRSSFGGVQKFSGERVLWYVFHPPYVLHPPISRPNFIRGATRARSVHGVHALHGPMARGERADAVQNVSPSRGMHPIGLSLPRGDASSWHIDINQAQVLTYGSSRIYTVEFKIILYRVLLFLNYSP